LTINERMYVFLLLTKLQCTYDYMLQLIFLAPTGALEEGMLSVRACVCDIIQMIIENEF